MSDYLFGNILCRISLALSDHQESYEWEMANITITELITENWFSHFPSSFVPGIIVFPGKRYVQDIIALSRFRLLGREAGTESRKLTPPIKRNRPRDETTRDHCRLKRRRRRESEEQRGRSRVPRALGCRDDTGEDRDKRGSAGWSYVSHQGACTEEG